MNSGEDEQSSFGLNGRLRPRKPNGPSQLSLKANRRTEGKNAQDKPKRTNTPSKVLPNIDDLANKSDFSLNPQILCPYCEKKFSSKQTLSKHSRRIHFPSLKQDGFIKCMHCNHVESDANNIIRHMVDSHPNQYFACLDCHTRFPSTTELAEHKLNVCENQKPPYRNKLRRKRSVIRKKRKSIEKGVIQRIEREYQDGHGFNGIVISCELKPSRVNDGADIEDNITTNLILPPNKNLVKSNSLNKNAVIVLDDIQWNKRMPANFAFHNTDADQILSRLGVVHRSPRTGESNRRDWFKTIDESIQKFEKCFDTSFYSKVASNVQENLSKYLDGSFNFNPDPDNIIKTRKAKNSVVINTAEGFPILLACEQFSRNVFEGYNMPRAIAPKHKWKRDSLDIDKSPVNPDQIKRDSHTNNCIITLVSSLDIWTQLCMRNKFEDKYSSVPIEKKTEKQNIISKELKEILESREIPTLTSNVLKNNHKHVATTKQDFPTMLGLVPSTPVYKFQPAVLSGEWVRPRCYVCCACGAQTYDGRELTSHKINHHPNAQVQHYEIAGELLQNADILKHLYVPPSQTCNRTRPPRGIRECTKCKKSVSLEDLHQHMLDCAGDTPTVRRKCRNRPFGVRKRRTRLPDNAMTKKIRKHLRNRRGRQKNHVRPRPRVRTEVGDAETIRKMLADLPAKRHRVMVNPINLMQGSHKSLEEQRSKIIMKRRSSESAVVRKNVLDIKSSTSNDDFANNDGMKKSKNVNINLKNKLLNPKLKRVVSKANQRETLKRKIVRPNRNVARLKRQVAQQINNQNEPQDVDVSAREHNDQLANENLPQRINLQGEPYHGRQNADANEPNNREGHEQPGNGGQNRNEQNIPLEANNVPLKHSIASLTADSETQDKSVQFHQLFLVQQECNNVDEHGAAAQQIMFENEDIAVELDKPPLQPENQIEEKQACVSDSQKGSADPQAAQKGKSNKPRKGLNDCIAMLRNKLVDPLPSTSGHVSVQCGSDEPLYPLPTVSQEIKKNTKDAEDINKASADLLNKSFDLKIQTDCKNEEIDIEMRQRSKLGSKKTNMEQQSSKIMIQKQHSPNVDSIEKYKTKMKIIDTEQLISNTQEIINVTQASSRSSPALALSTSIISQQAPFPGKHETIRVTSESASRESPFPHKSDCDMQKPVVASRNPINVTQETVAMTRCSISLTEASVSGINEISTFKKGSVISKEMLHDALVSISTVSASILDCKNSFTVAEANAGTKMAKLGKKKSTDIGNPKTTCSLIIKNEIQKKNEKSKDEANRYYTKSDNLAFLSQTELSKERDIPSKTIKSVKDKQLNEEKINFKNTISTSQSIETNAPKDMSKHQCNLYTEKQLNPTHSLDIHIEQNSILSHREETHIESQNQNVTITPSDTAPVESITPLDLSGKTYDLKQVQDKKDVINVSDYDCLDLSNKKLNTLLKVDDVVDLRISTILNKQSVSNKINKPDLVNENVTDLSIKTCLQNVPTDLSIKSKVNVMSTNFSGNVKNLKKSIHEPHSEKHQLYCVGQTRKNISKKLNVVSDDVIKDLSGKCSVIASGSNIFPPVVELNALNDLNKDAEDMASDQPTDLSRKISTCVQKDSGITRSTLTVIQSEQLSDNSAKYLKSQEKSMSNTQINEKSSEIQKPFYDPSLRIPQYKVTLAAVPLSEQRSIMAPTAIRSSASEANGLKSPLTNKSLNNEATSEKASYNLNNIVATTFGKTADYNLPNRATTTTFGKIDNTKPVYTLSNACITVTKINNTGSTVLTNTLLSIPGTTIASTTSVYTLAGSSSGAPINYGTIANPSCHMVPDNFSHSSITTLQSNMSIENVNLQHSPEANKYNVTASSTNASKEKEEARKKEMPYDSNQDSEIAKKIAMLPKELVEILGTMPLDHRNQLLNVLPQYVSTIPASISSTVYAESRFDMLPKKRISSTLSDSENTLEQSEFLQATNERISLKSSHNLVDLQRSASDLDGIEDNFVSSPLVSPLLRMSKSKSVSNDDEASKILINRVPESVQNTRSHALESTESCRSDLFNDVIDLTVDENPNEIVKEEISYIEPTQLSTCSEVYTTKQQKSNNERTASLRAVRIRNASERHKSNSGKTYFCDKIYFDQDNLTNLHEEDLSTTIEGQNQFTCKADELEMVETHIKQSNLNEKDEFETNRQYNKDKINKVVVVHKDERINTYSGTNISVSNSESVEIITDENESKVNFTRNNAVEPSVSEDLKVKNENEATAVKFDTGLIVQSVETQHSVESKTEVVDILNAADAVDANFCDLPVITSQHQVDDDSNICVATDVSNDNNQDSDVKMLSHENASPKHILDHKISNDNLFTQNRNISQEDDSDDDVTLALIVKQKQSIQKTDKKVENNRSLNKTLLPKKINKERRKISRKDDNRRIVRRSSSVTNKESCRNRVCASSKVTDQIINTNAVEISADKVHFPQKAQKTRFNKRKIRSTKYSEGSKVLVNKQTNDNYSLEKDDCLDRVLTKITDTDNTKKNCKTQSVIESQDSIENTKKAVGFKNHNFNREQNSFIKRTVDQEINNEVKSVGMNKTAKLRNVESNFIQQTDSHTELLLNNDENGLSNRNKVTTDPSNGLEKDCPKLVKSQIDEQKTECSVNSLEKSELKNKSVRLKKKKSEITVEEISKSADIDAEDNVSQLRRSRRVKSLFLEDVSEHIDNQETLTVYKTPLTKKQLIFSKMLHDEDNSGKLIHAVTDTKINKESRVDENDINVKQVPDTFISHEKEADLPDCQVEKNNPSKRKKTLQVKQKPKKKKTENNQNLNEINVECENTKTKSEIDVSVPCSLKGKQSYTEDISRCDEKLNKKIRKSDNSHFNVILEKTVKDINTGFSSINESNQEIKTKGRTEKHKGKKCLVDQHSESNFPVIISADNLATITDEVTEDKSIKETIHKNKRDICDTYPNSETRMTCYNKSVAIKRTRSRSSTLKRPDEKVFDPYDIDLDETIETTQCYSKKRHISEKNICHKSKLLETSKVIKKVTKMQSFDIEAITSSDLQKEDTNQELKNNENDSDESSKSDVPLNKYVKETGKSEKAKPEKANCDVDKTSETNQGSENFDLEIKGRSVEISLDSAKTYIQAEDEDQLKSEQFMESFGFFSERKPRKSNLLASKKISETFHIIANESDELCFHNKEKTGASESSATEVVLAHQADDEKLGKNSDVEMDAATAKLILESEEVRNLENDLISGLKEAAHAGSLNKTNIDSQYDTTDTLIGVPEAVSTHFSRAEPHSDHVDDFDDVQQNPCKPKKTAQKPTEAKNRLVLDTMEHIDIFEDKFDKIKRKCRSQAAAAKQTQTIVEQQNSRRSRRKTEKKGKKVKKNRHSAVLTKGALKGFDGPTSTNMATPTSLEMSTKKKKKNSPKKKTDKKEIELSKHYSHNINKECPQSQRKVDVYEFMDDELFEFRPSTLMERFKSINNKETFSMKPINVSNEVENSNMSASDGDDFVYMSDDYVCSDDETENSLISFDMGSKQVADSKKTPPFKRKDVVEKNAVMGKIFKNNAVRSEKKSIKSKEPEQPKTNFDQLFDSLFDDKKNPSMVSDDTSKNIHHNTPTTSYETLKRVHENKCEDFVSGRKHDTPISNRHDSISYTSKKYSMTSPNARCTNKHESSFRKLESNETSNNRHYTVDSFLGPSTSKSFDMVSIKDITTVPKTNEIVRKYDIDKFYDKSDTESLLNDAEELSMDKFGVKTKAKDKSTLEKVNKGVNSCVVDESSQDLFNTPLLLDEAGVARQRARRKCAVGKQNVLAETWSSESEAEVTPPRPKSALAVMVSTRKKRGRKKEPLLSGGRRNKNIESRVTSSIHGMSSCACASGNRQGRLNISGDRVGRLSVSGNKEIRLSGGAVEFRADSGKVKEGERIENKEGAFSNQSPMTSKVRPRPSTYYWSSEGDEEQEHYEQHGWIVGDSHKKLVTMLAHAKGRKRNNDDKRHFVE